MFYLTEDFFINCLKEKVRSIVFRRFRLDREKQRKHRFECTRIENKRNRE